jgi:DNA mismatch endonuclease (patch repair protein)
MRSIRSKGNESTEIRLAGLLTEADIQGWGSHVRIGDYSPDFSFPANRLATFVDGCFWHGCPIHSHEPSRNRDYWIPKLARNEARDRASSPKLAKLGWKTLRIWEHELADGPSVIAEIKEALASSDRRASSAQESTISKTYG